MKHVLLFMWLNLHNYCACVILKGKAAAISDLAVESADSNRSKTDVIRTPELHSLNQFSQ